MWEITVLAYCFKIEIITRRNHLKSWKYLPLESRAEEYEGQSQKAAVFSWWAFEGSHQWAITVQQIWVPHSVPWGAVSSYGKAKVQASKPNPQVSAFQGFDQVMSVRQSKDKPKVKGPQVERKEEIFLKNNPIYPK